ncbi:histidinol dehydrogenase, partial [Acinetobacter baumannii]
MVFLFRLVGKLMRRLSTQDQNFKQVFAELLAFETVNDPNLVQTVD